MTKIITALLFGYLLVALEALVPGGVLGILGFISILLASYFAHLEFGGWIIPLLVFMFGSLGGVLLIFFQFKWLAKSDFGKKMFVNSTSGTVVKEDESLQNLIGKHGYTQTDHHPEGLVRIDGKNYDSYSLSGYLSTGVEVKIEKLDGFRLIVRAV